ncbi:hypothetical protein DAPPUDRAFT_310097 [Daphnia pulex]|uniref:Uncharacterized protein n=1 Tax=Daphnia pulex TaxID=6669 RepID=E9FSE8_DAPPU|nr:hypothetical protein DAPPUDRAFT_310097 [Daphnia pulex]|eukprot:EFX89844.1 hypothetical protein DAPPUDRAFT_310097 [Daphnia pulex]
MDTFRKRKQKMGRFKDETHGEQLVLWLLRYMCVNLQAVLWFEKLVKIVENPKLSLLHLLSKVPYVINKQVFSQVNYAGRQTIKPV